jgi:hypothetical protein
MKTKALQQNHVFFINNIVIRLNVESNVLMSMTKTTNYVHFD